MTSPKRSALFMTKWSRTVSMVSLERLNNFFQQSALSVERFGLGESWYFSQSNWRTHVKTRWPPRLTVMRLPDQSRPVYQKIDISSPQDNSLKNDYRWFRIIKSLKTAAIPDSARWRLVKQRARLARINSTTRADLLEKFQVFFLLWKHTLKRILDLSKW